MLAMPGSRRISLTAAVLASPLAATSHVNASIASTGGAAPADPNPTSVFDLPYEYASALTSADSVAAEVKAGAGPR